MSEFLCCQLSPKRLNDFNWKEGRERQRGEKEQKCLESQDGPRWMSLTLGSQRAVQREEFLHLLKLKMLVTLLPVY